MSINLRVLALSVMSCLVGHGISFAAQDIRDSESPFGVLDFVAWDHDWNRHYYAGDKVERAGALMKEAGVGFVRMDFLWLDIEPRKGRFDFKKYDRIVDILSKNGIKILGILEYNPSWVTPWNKAPDHAGYVNYAAKVVEHFKERVKYWEIWNEPDIATYWIPQDDLKTYSVLLKEVYPALKNADPTCAVVLGGFSRDFPFQLKRVYQNGAGHAFDIVNIHPFVSPLLPNAMEVLKGYYRSVYKVMEKYDDAQKPIWFTELGCPGSDDRAAKGWWGGKSPTEKEQAAWVEKVYGEPLRWKGVEKVFWAFFRDTPDHFKSGVDHFGLLREDFSKKASFESYKKMARSLESRTSN
jgi:hypothetical protein